MEIENFKVEFQKWLQCEIEQAYSRLRENNNNDISSFGAGYDSGYYNALMYIKEELNDFPA